MSDEQKPEEIKWQSEDYQKIVTDLSKEIHALLLEKIKEVPTVNQWIIYGRVMNFIFQNHYAVSFIRANDVTKDLKP